MDFSYHFQGLDFEWNAEKASLNLKNHKVSFETACEVFFTRFCRLRMPELLKTKCGKPLSD